MEWMGSTIESGGGRCWLPLLPPLLLLLAGFGNGYGLLLSRITH
jgi:hypothetical protein